MVDFASADQEFEEASSQQLQEKEIVYGPLAPGTSRCDNMFLSKTLGQGATSKVKLGITPDYKKYAVKLHDLSHPNIQQKHLKMLGQEAKTLEALSGHKNIVAMGGYNMDATVHTWQNKTKKTAYITLELLEGGELTDYVINGGIVAD